jgi:hypothetical protein
VKRHQSNKLEKNKKIKKIKREREREKESNVRERRRPSVFSVSPIFVSRNDDAVCIPVADSIKTFGFTFPNCFAFKTL